MAETGGGSLMGNLFVVVTSILSSGVIAAIISFSFAEAKERWVLRRSKIEEVYLSAADWIRSISGNYLHGLRVCKGDLTYNQMLDLQLQNKDKSSAIGAMHLRMKMNIYMYEPSLVPAFEAMQKELTKTNRIMSGIEKCWEKTGQASELFSPLNKQIEALEIANNALLAAIVERGVAIGAEKGQAAQAYDLTRSKLSKGAAWLRITANHARSRLPRRVGPPHS